MLELLPTYHMTLTLIFELHTDTIMRLTQATYGPLSVCFVAREIITGVENNTPVLILIADSDLVL